MMWRWMMGVAGGLATHNDRVLPLARVMQSMYPQYAVIRKPELQQEQYLGIELKEESEYSGEAVRDMMNDNIWQAVPKRKTSVMKRRLRRNGQALKPINHYERCFGCGDLKLRHCACSTCGWMKYAK